MRGKRARLLRAEANTRYDDGERHYDDHDHRGRGWRTFSYSQERSSFYRRLKNKWTRTHKVS